MTASDLDRLRIRLGSEGLRFSSNSASKRSEFVSPGITLLKHGLTEYTYTQKKKKERKKKPIKTHINENKREKKLLKN